MTSISHNLELMGLQIGIVKNILIIYGGHVGGRVEKLTQAVVTGAAQLEDEVSVRSLHALQAGVDDLLWADGLLIGSPEHFGYMAGAVKDFMDRTFYPVEGKRLGLPYAVFISAGNDGTGAAASIERIALGYRWKPIAPALIIRGEPTPADLAACQELGQTLAAGLTTGIF